MTTSKLPARPSLESLRKQAKKLARGIVAGHAVALAGARAICRHSPAAVCHSVMPNWCWRREYGFPGWQDLVEK